MSSITNRIKSMEKVFLDDKKKVILVFYQEHNKPKHFRVSKYDEILHSEVGLLPEVVYTQEEINHFLNKLDEISIEHIAIFVVYKSVNGYSNDNS